MGKSTSQLDLFRQELAKLPKTVPTKGMWASLHHVLTDFNNQIDDLRKTVRGDGNGESGLLARVKSTEDKIDEILELLKNQEKKDRTPERTWFIEKVLPGLFQALIIAITTAIVALYIAGK